MQEDDYPIDPCPCPAPHLLPGRDDPLALCRPQGLTLWPGAEDLSLWWCSLGVKSLEPGSPSDGPLGDVSCLWRHPQEDVSIQSQCRESCYGQQRETPPHDSSGLI